MNSPYRVESFIPIPPKYDYKRRYPFNSLNVGQSFLVPCAPQDIDDLWNTLSSCRRWAMYKTGFKFTARRVLDGIRIWRTF